MSLLLALTPDPPAVDDPATRGAVYGEDWQPEDTYHESAGEIPQYIEVEAGEELLAAVWEETPDLYEDDDYVQDQYTEPIGGPETYTEVVEEFHEPEHYDASALADAHEDSLEGIDAIVDDPYEDNELYDPSFTSDFIDELDIDDSLEGIDAPTDAGSEEEYPDIGGVAEPWEEPLDGIVALWVDWEVEIEWAEWSTDFDAEAEPVRRPRRPSIRPIAEGYGTARGVEAATEVGRPRAYGTRREGVPGVAIGKGAEAGTENGRSAGGGGARAVPKIARSVRASAGMPQGHGGGCACSAGYEAKVEFGIPAPRGAGVARASTRGAKAESGKSAGRGVTNPSNEEILSIIVAVRKRRRKRWV